ncbi:hypothetical protein BLTE_07440 [Blastochloris tepida]|uniref:Uncharacterized protein n=1 Tax=Blastochloris tepida TaxID=2233851 RepID=A0A348FXM6_9HYPH|nr:hypothetical protein BLTE_07440 [Blastochloris tepida]
MAITDSDNENGPHVVENCKRQEEHAQARRDAGAKQTKTSDNERRVGGHHGPPTVRAGLATHDSKIERCRNDHSAEGPGKWQRCPAQIPQLPKGKLALELQRNNKEKERHQSIVDPMAQRATEVLRSDVQANRGLPKPEKDSG